MLDALIAAAEQHNQDLRLAVARVDEARALAGIAQADLLPSLNASAQGSRAAAARWACNLCPADRLWKTNKPPPR